MTTQILTTKLFIPSPGPNQVSRSHLLDHLQSGLTGKLTLISAPAGYGKSTLLSEWVLQVDIPVAWLSLEKGENSPARFWNYIIAALDTIPHLHRAGVGELIFQALQTTQPPPMDALLTNLVNDFSKLKERAVLVLDDLHTITDGQIHQDLVYLIDHLPPPPQGLHLVVSSRMDPPWPFARWRARGELNELRPADLRFNYDETVSFLNQFLQLKLLSQDIAALQDRTEGWIAGLQMAAVSMQGWLKTQGSQGVSHFIETFTGSHQFILDYLMEEVINQQPAEMRDFLYETSILEQLTAPLCAALTGRQDSQTMLEQVERANLFLIALDDERKWYRYHHLFADLLHKRLKEMQPDHITELHRRASEWYAGNDYLSEAFSHAMDAEDFPLVNELVSRNVLAMVELAELFDVLRQFEQIPDSQISSNPWLGVAYAWTKAYVDPSVEMDRILQLVEQSLTGVENPLERQHLESHLDAIRAFVAWVKGDADEALAFARSALEDLSENDWMARSHILNIQGLALQYNNDLDGAIQSFEAAIIAGQGTDRKYETFYAYTNLAYVKLLKGRLHQAFSLCQQVLIFADKSRYVLKRMPVLAYAYATMSLVHIEWYEVESAISCARESVDLAEQWNQADALHFALTCLSKAFCIGGDLKEAFAVNQQAMQLGVSVSPWYFRLSVVNEIWLNLAKGDISAAGRRLIEIEPLANERERKYALLIYKAALLNAQRNYLGVLTVSEEFFQKHWEMNIYLVKLMSLQALALLALDREEDAIRTIGDCLALAAPEGFVHIFVEKGESMARLLQMALSRGIETEYIKGLLLAFQHPVAPHESEISISTKTQHIFQNVDLTEPLSEREMEVLRFLNTRLSTPEIAREMVIATSTIRTHVRNIYNKLDVHGRIEAIQKAKDLGLI